MGQNKSREETKDPSKQLNKAKEEPKVKDPPPQTLPESPKTLQKPTYLLPLLPSSSNANEELLQPAPSIFPTDYNETKEVLKKAIETVKEPNEEILQISKRYEDETNGVKKKPYMYEDIIREAEKRPAGYSDEQLRGGIYLNNRTKKYWVDATGYNCFMLFAKALQITWIEDEQFWCWITITESNSDIEVARLLDVCWLEIHGRQEISYLNPGITYEVFFIVKREQKGYGWTAPVNLRLKIPSESTQQHKENMEKIPEEKWMELRAGEFTTGTSKTGEIEFSLFDYEGGLWKRGLLVKGAIIRPKNMYI